MRGAIWRLNIRVWWAWSKALSPLWPWGARFCAAEVNYLLDRGREL